VTEQKPREPLDRMYSFRMSHSLFRQLSEAAQRERLTESQLLRRLVEDGLKDPRYARAVDISEYGPQPVTVASGTGTTHIELDVRGLTRYGHIDPAESGGYLGGGQSLTIPSRRRSLWRRRQK
jgi:hypothetical protein